MSILYILRVVHNGINVTILRHVSPNRKREPAYKTTVLIGSAVNQVALFFTACFFTIWNIRETRSLLQEFGQKQLKIDTANIFRCPTHQSYFSITVKYQLQNGLM